MSAPVAAPGKGAIYDLGYARYAGERRPPSTLWRVIMRQQLAHAWKTLWRFKLPLLLAIVATVGLGVVFYLRQSDVFRGFQRAGAPVGFLDLVLFIGYRIYAFCAFFVTMTVAAPMIARDEESGAFTFYFSRPVRARDYVLGKLAALAVLNSALFLAGPLLLCIFRMALAEDLSEALALWPWIPRTLLIGTLATIAYASIPLAVSSLASRRTMALGLWAGFYVIATPMLSGIGTVTWKPLISIDLVSAIMTMVAKLFDLARPGDPAIAGPLWAAIGSLVLQSALAIFILARRVEGKAIGAVGGSS